jgi:hypothetical protein
VALAAELRNAETWPALLELARQQQVEAALAQRIARALAFEEQLPAAIAQSLRETRLNNVRRNMKILAQALKLAQRLNAANIVPLFLKGTAQLLASEQAEYGFRQQLDIDLLLPREELDLACDVLLRDGYSFCVGQDRRSAQPLLTVDKPRALRQSRVHHHLLPLAKPGYPAVVELHRHHLPRRFQAGRSTELMFASATGGERSGARFLLPSASQQIILMLLGRFVHDGYARRYDFPIRTACDYRQVVARAGAEAEGGAPGTGLDLGLIESQCGGYLALFNQLVLELTGCAGLEKLAPPVDTRTWIKLLEARYRWPVSAGLLDAQARVRHLAISAVYSPAKLPGYIKTLLAPPWYRRG